MIRINLLEKREAPTKTKTAGGGLDFKISGSITAIAAALIICCGLGFIGWNWYRLDHRTKTLNDEIAQADQEINNLKKALKTMDEFQAKKKALEHRVELISDLKRKQNVPVQLLDMVSRQVPDFLWLEGLDEKSGAIALRGKATTYNAVSNFYNNLKDSPFFADVTLGVTQKVTEGVSFVLSCRFLPPPMPEQVAPAGAPAPGAAPAGAAPVAHNAGPAPRG